MSQINIIDSVEHLYKTTYPLSEKRHTALKQYMPSGHVANMNAFRPYPLHIAKGEGAYVFTHEGHKLLDLLNGYSSFIHGHADPEILSALGRSHKKGFYFGSPTSAQYEFSKLLCERIPGAEKIRISNSGTEATLFALRTARAYTKRSKFIKFFGGYHGTHDCVAVSPKKDPLSEGVAPNVNCDVIEVEFNDFALIEKAILENKNDLAAVIIEPYLGGAGSITPLPGYLEFIRKLTKQHGIVLIFDEIVTFRVHEQGAQGLFNVEPDLTTLGKIVGGGLPIGMLVGKDYLMQLYGGDSSPPSVHHGGTFFGYEAALIAGHSALQRFTQKEIDKLNQMGLFLQNKLEAIADAKGIHMQINRMGSILAFQYTQHKVTNFSQALTSEREIARLVHLSLLNKGIYTAPYGKYYILSTVMTGEMLEFFVATFDQVLEELLPWIKEKFPQLIRVPKYELPFNNAILQTVS